MISQDRLPCLGNRVPILKSISLKGSILRSCHGDMWRGCLLGVGASQSLLLCGVQAKPSRALWGVWPTFSRAVEERDGSLLVKTSLERGVCEW